MKAEENQELCRKVYEEGLKLKRAWREGKKNPNQYQIAVMRLVSYHTYHQIEKFIDKVVEMYVVCQLPIPMVLLEYVEDEETFGRVRRFFLAALPGPLDRENK